MSDQFKIGPFTNVQSNKEITKSSPSPAPGGDQQKKVAKNAALENAAFMSKKGSYKLDGGRARGHGDSNYMFKLDVEQCETQFRLNPEAATTDRFNGTANIKLPMSPRSKPISPQRRQQQLKKEHLEASKNMENKKDR